MGLMDRHNVQSLFSVRSLYKQHVKCPCVKVDINSQAFSEKLLK
jgi:hypothetical protein